jgi:hypothetical protein
MMKAFLKQVQEIVVGYFFPLVFLFVFGWLVLSSDVFARDTRDLYFKMLDRVTRLPEGARAIPSLKGEERIAFAKQIGLSISGEKLFDPDGDTYDSESLVYLYVGDFSNEGFQQYAVVSRSGVEVYQKSSASGEWANRKLSDVIVSNLFPNGDMSRFYDPLPSNLAPFAFRWKGKTYLRYLFTAEDNDREPDINAILVCTYIWQGTSFRLTPNSSHMNVGVSKSHLNFKPNCSH